MMWCDIDPYDWSNKFYGFYMAAVMVLLVGQIRLDQIRLDYYRFKGLHKRNKPARGASPTYIHNYLNIQKENYN